MAAGEYSKESVDVSRLELGMYVADLDRPWLDSPFMLQGFLLEDNEQIKQLQYLCKTVIIDKSLSIGNHYLLPPKEDVAFVRKDLINIQKVKQKQSNKKTLKPSTQKVSFFDILRELTAENKKIKQSNKLKTDSKEAELASHDPSLRPTPKRNIHQAVNSSHPISKQQHLSLGKKIKQDIFNVIQSVKNLIPDAPKFKLFGNDSRDINITQELSHNHDLITAIEEVVPVEDEMAVIYPVFKETKLAIREIFESIATENKINLINVNKTLDSMVESIERNPDALMWLAKLKQRDDYAYNHGLNVSINLMAFAQFMALPKTEIKDLGMAGLLQDIGKLKLSAEVLHKKATLSHEEFDYIKTHVTSGLEILQNTAGISANVLDIVANHHERMDGSGYPAKLKTHEISLSAQMAGLMDAYCAITSDKPYAKGVFNQRALEEIYASRDKKFNSTLVNQLIQFFGIYPVSSLVELNSGEVAVVIQQNHVRRLQPRVVVLLAPDKTRIKSPVTLDLIYSPLSPNGEPYSIVRGLDPDSYGLNPSDFYM